MWSRCEPRLSRSACIFSLPCTPTSLSSRLPPTSYLRLPMVTCRSPRTSIVGSFCWLALEAPLPPAPDGGYSPPPPNPEPPEPSPPPPPSPGGPPASGRRLLQDGEDVDLLEPQEAAADAVHVEQDDVDAADLEGSA